MATKARPSKVLDKIRGGAKKPHGSVEQHAGAIDITVHVEEVLTGFNVESSSIKITGSGAKGVGVFEHLKNRVEGRHALVSKHPAPIVEIGVIKGADPQVIESVDSVNVELRVVKDRILVVFPAAKDTVSDLDDSIWGPAPSAPAAIFADMSSKRREFEARKALNAQSTTRKVAAELLGISEQAVGDRIADGDLVALKKGREWRLPLWQFDADTEAGYLPGLAELQRAFPGNALALSDWVTRDNDRLESAPVDALRDGRISDVVDAVSSMRAFGW